MDFSKGKWIEPARHEEQTCAGTGTGLEIVRRRLENAFPNHMRPKLLKKKVVFSTLGNTIIPEERNMIKPHKVSVIDDENTIRAFEVNAPDYLPESINPDRLARALEKLELHEQETPAKVRKLNYDDRLFLLLGRHFKFMTVNTILNSSAAGDDSEVPTSDGHKGLALKSMKEWETRLPAQPFTSIHCSTIINMEFIDRVEEPYLISRRYAIKLKQRLG